LFKKINWFDSRQAKCNGKYKWLRKRKLLRRVPRRAQKRVLRRPPRRERDN